MRVALWYTANVWEVGSLLTATQITASFFPVCAHNMLHLQGKKTTAYARGHSGAARCCDVVWGKPLPKVFYGQEPPSEESTTTECEVNYQLLAVITEVVQWGAPSCSRPQLATDNGFRNGRFTHPPLSLAVLTERLVHSINRCSLSSTGNRPCNFSM